MERGERSQGTHAQGGSRGRAWRGGFRVEIEVGAVEVGAVEVGNWDDNRGGKWGGNSDDFWGDNSDDLEPHVDIQLEMPDSSHIYWGKSMLSLGIQSN